MIAPLTLCRQIRLQHYQAANNVSGKVSPQYPVQSFYGSTLISVLFVLPQHAQPRRSVAWRGLLPPHPALQRGPEA
jgi:hypothetical protein